TLRSVAETALIRGVGKPIADKLESVATVHFGGGTFVPAHASLLTIKVMEGEDKGAVDLINRQREQAGQRTALDIGKQDVLVGNPLTISIVATLGTGARSRIRQIVILTGRAANPYILKERY